MTTNVNKPQDASLAAAKGEARRIAQASGSDLVTNALAPAPHNLEQVGAQHRITATNPGPKDDIVHRTGLIRSMPVSTDWQAIEDAFAAPRTQREIRQRARRDGGMD